MPRTDLLRGFGVLALVVVIVVAATFATGTVLSSSPESESVNASAYNDELLPTPVDNDGRVEPATSERSKTVVIDKSHGNVVTESDLQPLVDALVSAGHEVQFYTGGSSSGIGTGGFSSGSSEMNATLRSADAFVVVNPASTYTTGEINGIEAFSDAGGRVLMLADPVGSSSSGTSISLPIGVSTGSTVTPGQPTNLAANFGVSFGAGYLFDMTDNANNFQRTYAQPAGNSSLTAGVDRLVVNDATPLTTSESNRVIAESTDVQLSSTRRTGTYTVVARAGNVVTVGDTEFLQPASATLADNDAFVSNLGDFLVSGDKESGAPEPSESSTGTSGSPSPIQPDMMSDSSGNGTSASVYGTDP
jgi:hypothetical protein